MILIKLCHLRLGIFQQKTCSLTSSYILSIFLNKWKNIGHLFLCQKSIVYIERMLTDYRIHYFQFFIVTFKWHMYMLKYKSHIPRITNDISYYPNVQKINKSLKKKSQQNLTHFTWACLISLADSSTQSVNNKDKTEFNKHKINLLQVYYYIIT